MRAGVEQELAKKIVKLIKDSKLKVQASIQGDTVRVSRREAGRCCRRPSRSCARSITDFPIQFGNFRDEHRSGSPVTRPAGRPPHKPGGRDGEGARGAAPTYRTPGAGFARSP